MQLDKSCIGKVISEHPYVKLLTVPTGQIPLFGSSQMTCLAQVNETIALIEVTITREFYKDSQNG